MPSADNDPREQLDRALEELALARKQLVQQEGLRTLGELASGVAHDLNNSLMAIIGYVELLSADEALPQTAREKLKLVLTVSKDASSVVKNLQFFYNPRVAVDRTELIDLKPLIHQVVDITRPRWRDEARHSGRTIDISFELGYASPVEGNPTELRQVLTNMLLNAVDALVDGGTLTFGLSEYEGEVIIEITDQGVGMTEEERKHCFDPFFTTRESGSGLGLSVCHDIVARHGGRIDVDSRTGEGTTFRLTFQARSGPHAKPVSDG